MNRINELFANEGNKRILSIYYTAGYPTLNSTLAIAETLEKSGADFLEIGFPYSDPVADGPVIQHSSEVALRNGMTLQVLFDQLAGLRRHISIPVLLMGYVNPVLQYGVERFCESCKAVGVDGVIVPDLPMYEYEERYQEVFEANGVSNIFLVTPQTSEERIRKIDGLSTGFIYLLSSSATTGKNLAVSEDTAAYFSRIRNLNLKNPVVVGFGISSRDAFMRATDYAAGAIVGSAFVRLLSESNYEKKIPAFIHQLKEIADGY
ncbi:tryptophan synthase subunit alpha [Parapedobacter indicus]|uniref:Tryptophan synthase alpha chain n=1 Tax=Parapedobacter indicus TaxID=1477437 RepID=A0A1I3D1X4_9SPHI|nr:tryptophan synthase subunit alpha [Parapedobacter indicus]PPL04493.1 tryptophan synthase alpha chain [Parapedobacter indicus]SFH80697.1 tryptophan synthase, alpha chain [Parapedobacter indicus]